MSPVVSIILPAYRAEATLARAVTSVRAQTFQDWEVIIASDDGVDYLAGLGESDPRIRQVFTGGCGSGDGPARNAALAAAQGAFLACLDADDAFAPRRLETLLPLADAHGAAVDNTAVHDEQGRFYKQPFPTVSAPFPLTAEDILSPRIPLFPLFRRELAGPGWTDVAFCADVLFNLELLTRAETFHAHPDGLYLYHKTNGSMTHSADTAARAERGYLDILQRLEDGRIALAHPVREAAYREFQDNLRGNRVFARYMAEGRCRTLEEFLDMTDNAKSPELKADSP
ncbi:glycosyltransferase family 2 protein [Fodinicurvata halophila]|uniref:Glycosyltransferase family 2 protein n=1 Tax=Fodinicurvata halophila TaxID=1419723 RepID=A0ABV8UFE3_9PROT